MKIKEILEGEIVQFKSKNQLQIDELKKLLAQSSERIQNLASELSAQKHAEKMLKTAIAKRSKFKVIRNESDRNSK
jgi:predicted component of type VI protein secretion system